MTNIRISITTKSTPPASPTLPDGYSLYQYGDDFQTLGGARTCASGGCPAVMVLPDEKYAKPDTFFTKDWQFYLYAINKGMSKNAIIALMGKAKALFNSGGLSDSSDPRANYITGTNLTSKPPKLDKLRTFALNTHALKDVGNEKLQLLTMNGKNSPLLKPGKRYPNTLAEINPDDYLYLPQTHRHLFLDCTNVKWKKVDGLGNVLSYGPFENGLIRPWIGDGKMHTFFPLVSEFINICPSNEWNKVSTFPSPFRQP